MGSCLSTNFTTYPSKPPRVSTNHNNDVGSKSPPPVCEDTVNVKQVLTETPAIPEKRSPPPPVRRFHGSERMLHQLNGGTVKKPSNVTHRHSEIDSTENDAAFHWPRINSPGGGEVKRENTEGRSPASRFDKSPGRVKPGSGYGRKSGGGESSGRMSSRSPEIRSKTGMGGSKSSRRTGNHTCRVGYGSGERTRKGEGSEEMTKPPTNNDLLENSLVSLECFIFL